MLSEPRFLPGVWRRSITSQVGLGLGGKARQGRSDYAALRDRRDT
jgi:hypothetical protein